MTASSAVQTELCAAWAKTKPCNLYVNLEVGRKFACQSRDGYA